MIQHKSLLLNLSNNVESEGSRFSAGGLVVLCAWTHDDSRGKPFCNDQIWRKRLSARLLPRPHVKDPAQCHMTAWWHHLARGKSSGSNPPQQEYARSITKSLTTHRSNNKRNLTWSQLLPDTTSSDAELVSAAQTPALLYSRPLLRACCMFDKSLSRSLCWPTKHQVYL